MRFAAVKLICDVHIIPGKRIVRAGQTVHVIKELSGEGYRGLPTLLVMHDSVADLLVDGFFARPWEYTPDLGADVQALQATRIENKIQKGLPQWLADPKRTLSVESDSGAWWTLHGDPREMPRYSVSWIHDTGELYAWSMRDDQFILLAKTDPNAEARAEFYIEGWADSGSPVHNNLTALVEQIQARQDLPTPEKFVKEFTASRW